MTPLDALDRLCEHLDLDDNYFYVESGEKTDYEIVKNALNNYEWLLSKLDLDFIDRLNTEDRIKLAKIYGVKIDYE